MKEKKIKVGTKAICKSCGHPLIWTGEHWKHDTGDWQPRHIGIPKDDNEPLPEAA